MLAKEYYEKDLEFKGKMMNLLDDIAESNNELATMMGTLLSKLTNMEIGYTNQDVPLKIETKFKKNPLVKKKTTSNNTTKNKKGWSSFKGFYFGETEKAILIGFNGGETVEFTIDDKKMDVNGSWFPKSAMSEEYKAEEGKEQIFVIKDWILKKKELTRFITT